MRTGDSTCAALPLLDGLGVWFWDSGSGSGSGVLCFTISSVIIACAGSLSFDFAFFCAVAESVGLLIRSLKERVDWPAAVGPLLALRVLGGIVVVFLLVCAVIW